MECLSISMREITNRWTLVFRSQLAYLLTLEQCNSGRVASETFAQCSCTLLLYLLYHTCQRRARLR